MPLKIVALLISYNPDNRLLKTNHACAECADWALPVVAINIIGNK